MPQPLVPFQRPVTVGHAEILQVNFWWKFETLWKPVSQWFQTECELEIWRRREEDAVSIGQTLIRCWCSKQSLDPKNTDPLLVLKNQSMDPLVLKPILLPKCPIWSDPICSKSSSSLWVRRRQKRDPDRGRKCYQQARARLPPMEKASQVQKSVYHPKKSPNFDHFLTGTLDFGSWKLSAH